MKLTKDIKVKVYEVIADYKVKVTSSPFIAILKFAEEIGGEVDSYILYNYLLQPLSKKACENILERLTGMGYFNKEEGFEQDEYFDYDNYDEIPDYSRSMNERNVIVYSLTELGYTSAQQEEFYENRNGILKIYLAGNEFISQRIVKIKEINRQDSFEDKHIKNIKQTDLHELQNSNQQIVLEKDTFIIDNFKEKCRTFKEESNQLTLQTNETNSTIKLMDFSNIIQKNSKEVRNEILRNEFRSDYLEKEQILKIDFSPIHLGLQRNISVQKPNFSSTSFKQVEIQSLKLSPKNSVEARKWFKALVVQKVNNYFLFEKEFNEFVNKIAQEFELFSKELKNSLSKEDIIQELDEEKDFYKKAKLETIDYLNY